MSKEEIMKRYRAEREREEEEYEQMKVKECELYLTKLFDTFMVAGVDTIEVECLWGFTRVAGYSTDLPFRDSAVEQAIDNLLETTSVFDDNGDFLYLAYRLKGCSNGR